MRNKEVKGKYTLRGDMTPSLRLWHTKKVAEICGKKNWLCNPKEEIHNQHYLK